MNYTLSPLHFNCCMLRYVSFLNACYVGFGPVFFSTYEDCKCFKKLSGPQHSCQSIHSALIHHHPSNSSIIVLTVFNWRLKRRLVGWPESYCWHDRACMQALAGQPLWFRVLTAHETRLYWTSACGRACLPFRVPCW